jgi:hypothetical protein
VTELSAGLSENCNPAEPDIYAPFALIWLRLAENDGQSRQEKGLEPLTENENNSMMIIPF